MCRFHISCLLFLLCFFLAGIFSPQGLLADTRNIHGLNFFAEKLEPADNSNVLLTLFGHTVILRESSVNDRIIDAYFQKPDLKEKYDDASIEKFIKQALSVGDIRNAAIALAHLLGREEAEPGRRIEFLEGLRGQPGSGKLFEEVLTQEVSKKDVPLRLLYVLEIFVGEVNFEWIQLRIPVFHERDRDAFEAAIADLFVRVLKDQREEEARAIITFARRLLGPTNETARDLKYIFNQSRVISESAAKGDVEKVLPLLEVAKNDALLQRALGVYLYEQLHLAARNVLAEGRPEKAIKILSHINDEQEWTPHTFSLTLESLQKLSPEKKVIVLDPGVSNFLLRLVEKDAGLKHYYTRFLEGHIMYLARSDASLSQAEDFYQVLLGIRKPSVAANDPVKFALALSYLRNDKSLRARDMIEQMVYGPGIGGRLRLLLSGYYVNVYALIFLIFLPLLIFIPALMKVRRLLSEADEVARRRGFLDDDEDRILSQAKSILDVSSGMHPRRIEYQELLSVFELDDKAEEKDIKAAYRAMIKKVHPDIQSADDVKNSEKFIQITSAYERIMELRKVLKLK